jgi:hypothetical protein
LPFDSTQGKSILFSDFFIAKKIAKKNPTRQLAGNAPKNIFILAFLQL